MEILLPTSPGCDGTTTDRATNAPHRSIALEAEGMFRGGSAPTKTVYRALSEDHVSARDVRCVIRFSGGSHTQIYPPRGRRRAKFLRANIKKKNSPHPRTTRSLYGFLHASFALPNSATSVEKRRSL